MPRYLCHTLRSFLSSGLVFALALTLVGCGGGANLPEGETGTVTGKVTSASGDVPAGSAVIFIHKEKGLIASSVTDETGAYTLQMRNQANVLVGAYQVGVTPPAEPELTPEQNEAIMLGKAESPAPKEWPGIPDKLRSPDTSGITFDVKAGENTFDFELKAE